jgi:hypothetical protein
VGFETVAQRNGDVIADSELTTAGNNGTVRYRFRETVAGSVELWALISGPRTTGELSAAAAADAYVAALDHGSRAKTSSLIADAGRLTP